MVWCGVLRYCRVEAAVLPSTLPLVDQTSCSVSLTTTQQHHNITYISTWYGPTDRYGQIHTTLRQKYMNYAEFILL